jgi:very-short-patch-repair endonuclease
MVPMATISARERSRVAWELALAQHGVISRQQLRSLGYTDNAIAHRLRRGRLCRLYPAVFSVGPARPSHYGRWMAATLSCADGAVLSHSSAAALWGLGKEWTSVEVTVSGDRHMRRRGIRIHRSKGLLPHDTSTHRGISVTSPSRTLIDLATRLSLPSLEAAINAADKHGLVDPDGLRASITERPGVRGVPALRRLLDRSTFVLTDSELERRFLPLARAAGLSKPETGVVVNGFKVDFFWPEVGLVVETDGLRYHRTQAQQARDRIRDHAHVRAGLLPLRFTYGQVASEPDVVVGTLAAAVQSRRSA